MGWSGYMYIPRSAQRVQLLRAFAICSWRGSLVVSLETRELCERRMRWSASGAKWIRKARSSRASRHRNGLGLGFKHWFHREDIGGKWLKPDSGWSGTESKFAVGGRN